MAVYTSLIKINSTLTNRKGEVLDVIYTDVDDESELGERVIKGVHAYCFYKDKMVVVYAPSKGMWTPPGGGVEKGEDVPTAVAREVQEESNMKVLKHRLVGVQDIYEYGGITSQTRSVCIVEPYGPFVTDPDHDITEIRLIDPKEYKKEYFDWGIVGDRIMERALELKEEMEGNTINTGTLDING